MNIEFKQYKKGDYQLLTDIWRNAGLPFKPFGRDSEKNIEKEIELDSNRFIFAYYNDKAVGSIVVTHDGRKGWINRVAVLPEFRKKGIARKLVNEGERWLASEGIGIYACLIEGYNEDSLETFKKLGYIPFEGITYLTKRKYPEI